MPPSRRTPPTRRPRVAGARTRTTVTTPGEHDRPSVAGTASPAGDTTVDGNGHPAAAGAAPAPPEASTGAGAEPDPEARAGTGDESDPRGGGSRRLGRRGNIATLVALVAVFLVAMTLAVWFRGEADGLRSRADTNNTALVDAQATAQVNSEISAALETVYSYDFSTLDADQAAAGEVITGQFTEDYRALFAEVRELAPQQQAVVSAVVVNSAVKVLDGDRAQLVVFLNQQGTKGATGEQIAAAGRLTVTAQQVDGQWKIAAVENR